MERPISLSSLWSSWLTGVRFEGHQAGLPPFVNLGRVWPTGEEKRTRGVVECPATPLESYRTGRPQVAMAHGLIPYS